MHTLRSLWLVVGVSLSASADGPILRYTTYVIVDVPGKPTIVRFESRPYGLLHDDYVYRDQPAYAVMGSDGQALDAVDGKLSRDSTVAIPASAGPFAVVEAKPGNNYCIAHPEGAYGFVATPTAPLNVVRGFERLHFCVPKGVLAASLFLHAFSMGEAGRILIHDSNGKLVTEREDDFNQPPAVSFRVAEGQDGRVWSCALVKPRNPDWGIDDCKVWLSQSLPGVLSPRPDWAEKLSRPFAVAWRPVLDFEGESPILAVQWDRPGKDQSPPPSFDVGLSDERPHSGERSLRVEMKSPDEAAPRNELKIFTKPIEAANVERVGFWLYGDGSGRRVTVRIRDRSHEHHYCPTGTIDWTGWGEVVADFKKGNVRIHAGDGDKQITGPKVNVVIHIRHERGQPTRSVYDIDDLAISP